MSEQFSRHVLTLLMMSGRFIPRYPVQPEPGSLRYYTHAAGRIASLSTIWVLRKRTAG